MTLYGLLDHEARRWWYHAELRAKGNATEARRRERRSILDHARMLRAARDNGGVLTLKQGGFTLYFEANARLQGYDCDHMAACARLARVPIIDMRTAPRANLVRETVSGPMISLSPNDWGGTGWLAYVSPAEFARRWRDAGASVEGF